MKDIVENNKLITQFIGYQPIDRKNGEPLMYEFNGQFTQNGFPHSCHPNCLLFHSSWDWLMPVVEKIEEKGYNVIISKAPSIERSFFANLHIRPFSKTQYAEGDRLKRTYDLVVEFIKWYNEQNREK